MRLQPARAEAFDQRARPQPMSSAGVSAPSARGTTGYRQPLHCPLRCKTPRHAGLMRWRLFCRQVSTRNVSEVSVRRAGGPLLGGALSVDQRRQRKRQRLGERSGGAADQGCADHQGARHGLASPPAPLHEVPSSTRSIGGRARSHNVRRATGAKFPPPPCGAGMAWLFGAGTRAADRGLYGQRLNHEAVLMTARR
jgi:hypothetical protein